MGTATVSAPVLSVGMANGSEARRIVAHFLIDGTGCPRQPSSFVSVTSLLSACDSIGWPFRFVFGQTLFL